MKNESKPEAVTKGLGNLRTRKIPIAIKAKVTFCDFHLAIRMVGAPYVKGLSRHILAAEAAPVFHGSPDNGFAPFYAAGFCIFWIVCCPRKIMSCHLAGMLSPFLMMLSSTSGRLYP